MVDIICYPVISVRRPFVFIDNVLLDWTPCTLQRRSCGFDLNTSIAFGSRHRYSIGGLQQQLEWGSSRGSSSSNNNNNSNRGQQQHTAAAAAATACNNMQQQQQQQQQGTAAACSSSGHQQQQQQQGQHAAAAAAAAAASICLRSLLSHAASHACSFHICVVFKPANAHRRFDPSDSISQILPFANPLVTR